MFEPRPTSDPKRVANAKSRDWDRDFYAKQYGRAAMVEIDACRMAARNNDQAMMWDAMRRLSQALWRDNKKLFGVG